MGTEAIALVCGNTKTNIPARLRVLFDTGTIKNIALDLLIPNTEIKHSENITCWKTKGGKYIITGKCELTFKLPEFSSQKSVTWTMHIDSTIKQLGATYDMIIGTDLMAGMG